MSKAEKVISVIDASTFLTSSRREPVRLAGVNAPEIDEKGYKKASAELKKMIYGKTVTIEEKEPDHYGRMLALVKMDGKSVNQAMRNMLAPNKKSA